MSSWCPIKPETLPISPLISPHDDANVDGEGDVADTEGHQEGHYHAG